MAQSKNRKIVVSNGFHTLDDQLHDLAMTGEQHRGTADQNALLRHGTHPKPELLRARGKSEVACGSHKWETAGNNLPMKIWGYGRGNF